MIDADGKLIAPRYHLRRRGIGSCSKGPRRIVGQRIRVQYRHNRGTHRDRQRVSGKTGGVDPLPLGCGWNRKHLGGTEHLAKSLIFPKIKCAAAPIVNVWKKNRAAVGETEFIPNKWRNAPAVQSNVIEVVARIESRIADKFKNAARQISRARAGHHVRVTSSAMANLRRHHSGAGLHFFDSIHVEIRKRRTTHFRIRGIGAIDREDGCSPTLSIHRELLGKVRGAIGIGHGSGGKQQKLAEVTRVERQAGNFPAGEPLSSAGLRSAFQFAVEECQFSRTGEPQLRGEGNAVLDFDRSRGREDGAVHGHLHRIFSRRDAVERKTPVRGSLRREVATVR